MNSLVLLMLAAAADGGMDGGFDGGWRGSDGGLPPAGEYWVLRESRFSVGSTSGYPGRDGGPPESRQTWATRCDRVRLDAKTLEFEGGEVSFVVSRGMIFEPTVRSRYRASARATGHCRRRGPRSRSSIRTRRVPWGARRGSSGGASARRARGRRSLPGASSRAKTSCGGCAAWWGWPSSPRTPKPCAR